MAPYLLIHWKKAQLKFKAQASVILIFIIQDLFPPNSPLRKFSKAATRLIGSPSPHETDYSAHLGWMTTTPAYPPPSLPSPQRSAQTPSSLSAPNCAPKRHTRPTLHDFSLSSHILFSWQVSRRRAIRSNQDKVPWRWIA